MTPRDRYDSLVQFYAVAHGIEWQWLKAQMRAESNADPKAASGAGAKGLMQFMDPTWKEWAPDGDPFNPEHSLEAGAKYMRWLLDRFDGDRRRALAAYNWGIGNVRKCVRRYGEHWAEHLPVETRNYLARIQRYWGAAQTPRPRKANDVRTST